MEDFEETTSPDRPTPSAERPAFGIGSIVRHPSFGTGKVTDYEGHAYIITFMGGETKRVGFAFEALAAVEREGDPELDRVKQAMREVLGDYGLLDSELELGKRWSGGTVVLQSGNGQTKDKEIPLDMLFKKLIGIREKLRVLEQKINNHPKLSSEDKLELEGYISRSYGSLTSFNILFASKESGFHGTGKGSSDE